MKIVTTVKELKEYVKSLAFQEERSIGFVPTMGALHQGHAKLIKQAKEENEIVVVSIFLNPTQFLRGEDLGIYPKRDEADKKICQLSGVDILFFPSVTEIYSDDEASILAPCVRGFILEGFSRPGHFNGVLTVVMKLLNIVNPTKAYFGKKDAQQLHLIKLMVEQFFMDVKIIAVETERESDGLALSSRNAYLSKEQRQDALKISQSLHLCAKLVSRGNRDRDEIVQMMRDVLEPLEVFYVEILNRNFEVIKEIELGNSVVLVEAKVGTTRLLDNIWL